MGYSRCGAISLVDVVVIRRRVEEVVDKQFVREAILNRLIGRAATDIESVRPPVHLDVGQPPRLPLHDTIMIIVK